MRVYWELKRSLYAMIIIGCVTLIPAGVAFSMQYHTSILIIMLTLTPVLFYFLWQNISSDKGKYTSRLTWQEGLWTYHNNKLLMSGSKSKSSFAFSLVIFLSIKDEKGQLAELWLFPDSILDAFCTGFISAFAGNKQNYKHSLSEQGWRHLHSCFQLSDQITHDLD